MTSLLSLGFLDLYFSFILRHSQGFFIVLAHSTGVFECLILFFFFFFFYFLFLSLYNLFFIMFGRRENGRKEHEKRKGKC